MEQIKRDTQREEKPGQNCLVAIDYTLLLEGGKSPPKKGFSHLEQRPPKRGDTQRV